MKRELKYVLSLSVVLIIILSMYSLHNAELIFEVNRKLDRERLNYEALLAEKLSTEKTLIKMEKQITSLKTTHDNVSSQLVAANSTLQARATLITKHVQQLECLQFKLDSMVFVTDSVNQISTLLSDRIQKSAADVHNVHDSLAVLHAQYNGLKNEFGKQPSLDNVSVAIQKSPENGGGSKKRFHCIIVSLDLPSQCKNLSYVVSGPNGLRENQLSEYLDVRTVKDSQLTASKSNSLFIESESRKAIEVTYKTEKHLYPGKYTFTILNEGSSIGNVHVNLK